MPSFIHYTLSSKQMSHIFYLCKIVITITHKKQKGRKSIGNSSLTKEFISAKKNQSGHFTFSGINIKKQLSQYIKYTHMLLALDTN